MKILFICKSNINRSQMAEAFVHSLSPETEVQSAAAAIPPEWEGELISKMTLDGIAAMREVGIDMEHARIKQVTKSMIDDAEVVISMATRKELPTYIADSSKLNMWDIMDPDDLAYSVHTSVRDQIFKKVTNLLQRKVTTSFVIVVDSDNRVLLQHRTANAPTNPSKWQLWGGAIEKGETALEAASRELKEELSLEVTPEDLKLLEVYNYDETEQIEIYILHLKEGAVLSLGEGDGYGFFDLGAISTLDLEETTKSALTTYFKD